jgi:glycosyltransferase involved in cell wall biosynthesis
MKPASAKHNKSVSIIIPAFNAESTLHQVLDPLLPIIENWEILVVDDHSSDGTMALAQAMGVKVIPSNGYHNVVEARNTGALYTSGDILVFLDADVVTTLHDLTQSVNRLPLEGNVCMFAVYDRGDHLKNTVSRYKNFWIRHSTLAAPQPLQWLNSSLVVLTRKSFIKVGGFAGDFTCRHGGEDIDLGRRIAETGGAVALDKQLEVSHLKHFTLYSLWLNDQRRAQGWLSHALAFKGLISVIGSPSLANVSPGFSWSIIATSLAVLLAILTPLWPPLLLFSALLLLFGLLLNLSFLRAAFRQRIRGALLFIPLLWYDQIACATGIFIELISLVISGIRNGFHTLKCKTG